MRPFLRSTVAEFWVHREACGGFSAEIITLPGVASQGNTEDEAIANLREAFKGAIESYLESGSRFRGPLTFPLSACERKGKAGHHAWLIGCLAFQGVKQFGPLKSSAFPSTESGQAITS